MKVIAAAISDGKTVVSVPRPKRHSDIINAFPSPLHNWEQGFLTDTGEFVSRREALKIARRAGQLKAGHGQSALPRGFKELYSEDVW